MGYQSNYNRNNTNPHQKSFPGNNVLHGDCISVMRQLPARSVDFILTDPPYLVNYCDREGRSIQNDNNADGLEPAVRETYRVLKPNSFMVSFYAWNRAVNFMSWLFPS